MDELNKAESVTNITKGTRVSANIETETDIRIAGTVDGDIKAQKKLILSDTGRITGSVIAQDAILEGRFTGELRIKDHIKVTSSAVIDGFIFSKRISVHENAEVTGIVSVGPDVDVMNAKLTKEPKRPEIQQAVKKAKEAISDSDDSDQKEKSIETTSPFGNEPKPHKNRYIGNVLIGVPSADVDEVKAGEIKSVCENFMEQLGFELEIYDEPVLDSFYQKLTYVRKSSDTENDIRDLYKKGKECIETSLLNKGNSDANSALQNAADRLVQLFRQFDEFAITLGDIVLVQQVEDDVQSIAVEIVPEQLHSALKKDAELVNSPARVYSYVGN
ncbi:bactofilin family protein [Gracilimonas sp. BCB1]|uniref:bactofilin family protein n=1 Tax=Gracilimonas sp. BCB1 TaxID=3152362 RepID=UPI0032D99C3B